MAIERADRQEGGSGWREPPSNIQQNLLEQREQIDDIDQQIIALLAKRFQITSRVGEIKRANGMSVLDADREATLLAARGETAETAGLDPAFCEELFLNILRESRRRQENQLNEQR